jgi:hypothetical protein
MGVRMKAAMILVAFMAMTAMLAGRSGQKSSVGLWMESLDEMKNGPLSFYMRLGALPVPSGTHDYIDVVKEIEESESWFENMVMAQTVDNAYRTVFINGSDARLQAERTSKDELKLLFGGEATAYESVALGSYAKGDNRNLKFYSGWLISGILFAAFVLLSFVFSKIYRSLTFRATARYVMTALLSCVAGITICANVNWNILTLESSLLLALVFFISSFFTEDERIQSGLLGLISLAGGFVFGALLVTNIIVSLAALAVVAVVYAIKMKTATERPVGSKPKEPGSAIPRPKEPAPAISKPKEPEPVIPRPKEPGPAIPRAKEPGPVIPRASEPKPASQGLTENKPAESGEKPKNTDKTTN